MPRFYLLRSNNTFSDSADYPEQPALRSDGTWVEGLPEDIEPYKPLTLSEQLETIFEAQPVDIRAAFYPHRPAIKEALLNDDFEAAGFIINSVTVPAGLEAVKDDMLGVLKVVVEKQDLPDDFEASEQATPTTDASDWWTKLWQSVQAFFGGNNG